jgi:hypothetical protein
VPPTGTVLPACDGVAKLAAGGIWDDKNKAAVSVERYYMRQQHQLFKHETTSVA